MVNSTPHINTYILDTKEKLQEFFSFIKECSIDICSIDTETNSAQAHRALLWGVGLAFSEDEAFYIPFRCKDSNYVAEYYEHIVKDILNYLMSSKVKFIGHNVVYDITVLRSNLGIDITDSIHSDTILMKHTIDEERPHGLKETSVKYLGPWADKAQGRLYDSIKANGGTVTKENMQMFMADLEVLADYCMWDVVLTLKLYNLFEQMLKEQNLHTFFYQEEVMPLYRQITIPMNTEGFPIDIQHFKSLQENVTEDIIRLEQTIQEDIAQYVGELCYQIVDEKFPVKNTGKFPVELAAALDIPLPTAVNKDGEVKPTLATAKIKKYLDLYPQHREFYSWVLGDIGPNPLWPVLEIQTQLFFAANEDRPHVFNLNSNKHLGHLFFEVLRLEPTSHTDGGDPRVDEEFLESVQDVYPWITKLLEYKKLNKLKGTYIDGILDRQFNSRVFTSMQQFGTTSGRYASSNPNLNNLPAPQKGDSLVTKYTNAIRAGMVAPSGYRIVGADFSSLEPHLAASVSGDNGLIDIFVKGLDFYSAIGLKQFNIKDAHAFKTDDKDSFSVKYKQLRAEIKTYSLAAFYGAEASRISQVTGKTQEEAQDLLDGYFKAFPGVKRFIDDTHTKAVTYGYVKTKLGRVRHLPRLKELYEEHGWDLRNYQWAKKRKLSKERSEFKNLLNNAVNFQIQGMAAHALNKAMMLTKQELLRHNIKAHIALSVHDEQLVFVEEGRVEEAVKIIQWSMENCMNLDPIKLKAEPKVGNSYFECK